MFFNFTPKPESVPPTSNAPTQDDPPQPKLRFMQGADGKIVIDGGCLTKVISTSSDAPDEEALRLTSKWVHNVVSKDGRLGAWVPLAMLPEWQTPVPDSQ